LAGFLIGIFYYFKTEAGKENLDIILLKIPVIGTVVKYSYIALFAKNLGVLLKEGISIVKSLRIMSEVMGNVVYQKIMKKILKEVERGKSMTEGMLEDEEAFPKMVPQMIKIGEETGRTSEILENIEKAYTEQFYGYKGGEYRYSDYTTVNFEKEGSRNYSDGGYCSEMIAKLECTMPFKSQEERLVKLAFS